MKKKKKKISRHINAFLLKITICAILFLLFLICNKKIEYFNELIYKKIYNDNISFAKFNKWYESYFGSIFPIKKIDNIQVFNETINYTKKEKYKDGVLLYVDDYYIIPSISNGIVVFIGEKDDYGRTIIIEDESGLSIWYSNINIGNINMYDYVNKGDYIGETKENYFIMIFQKNGVIEDYNKYI